MIETKMVLFARADGKKRKRGKPARRRIDDITEWSEVSIWMAKREAQ